MNEMMKNKLSPDIQELINNHSVPDPISLIVQIQGEGEGQNRLNDQDRDMIAMLGGEIVDDLWLIKAYSCNVPAKALDTLVLSPRVTQVHLNSDVSG